MAGKRLLDLGLVLNATRRVALQHLRVRVEQVDTWSKTSSAAKAAKHQTDRVTLTLRAAAALSRRLNETYDPNSSRASVSTPEGQQTRSDEHGSIINQGLVGLDHDHHYERSADAPAPAFAPGEDLKVHQVQSRRHPLPDGSIPPSDALRDQEDQPEVPPSFSKFDQATTLKHPLVKHESASTTHNETVLAVKQAVPHQDVISEDINMDVFHSPKISKLLGATATKVIAQSQSPESQTTSPSAKDPQEQDRQISARRSQINFSEMSNETFPRASMIANQPEPPTHSSSAMSLEQHRTKSVSTTVVLQSLLSSPTR